MRAILAVVTVLFLNAAVPGTMVGAEKQTVRCVVEWEQSRASDAGMPPVTMAQLRAEFEKVAAAGAGLQSWEARCHVASRFGDRPAETYSTFLVSNGKQWLEERRLGDWQDAKIEYRRLCDKQITFPVMVDSRVPDGKAWGKTSAYYRVYSEPSDVWIDEKGRVARLDSERGWVGENDWWMGTVGDNRPKNEIERGR